MATGVRLFQASEIKLDKLIEQTEHQVNQALAQDLPAGAVVRSVTPQLFHAEDRWRLLITVLFDTPEA
jgi:hypothetical protein